MGTKSQSFEFHNIFFAKLAVTRCFNYDFLLSDHTHMRPYEVNTFPIYVRGKTFATRKFHKFLKFYKGMQRFTNSVNSQVFLVTILQ